MDGWREAGTSIPPCGCAGPRGVGPNPVRPTALSVAPRWDPEKCWSARRHVDVVARTGRISAELASSRSTPLRSGISVCSSRWMSATCARHSALTATRPGVTAVTVPDFSGWPESSEYRTRFSIDRQVWVDMLRVFPGLGSCARRRDEFALWIRCRRLAAGSVDGWSPGRVASAGGRRLAGVGAGAGGEHQ